MGVIQAELNRIAQHWNLHRIRTQNNMEDPSGRPDTLFFLPELEGHLYLSTLQLNLTLSMSMISVSG